jgi:effector-binding domain-containing protein
MISIVRLVDLPAQPVAALALTVPRAQIAQVMGPGLGELWGVLGAQGLRPVGPWFCHHLRLDPEVFDFEICLPIEGEVEATGRVRPGLRRAARIAQAELVGDYGQLASAWGELMAWISAEGLRPAPDLWEVYARGPESGEGPEGWLTLLQRPLLA